MGLYAALLRMMGMSTNIDQYTPGGGGGIMVLFITANMMPWLIIKAIELFARLEQAIIFLRGKLTG